MGLALLLLLSILPACAARHMPDWSRVQAVSPKTKTVQVKVSLSVVR